MKLGIPQLCMLAILFTSVGINLALHDEKMQGKYNFWWSLICAGLDLFILYKGGFF